MTDSVCNTADAIFSLLALKSQEVRESPARKAREELELLGISDEDIQALVDNELSVEDQQQLYEILLFYPALQRRYEELQKQKMQLKHWWLVLENRH